MLVRYDEILTSASVSFEICDRRGKSLMLMSYALYEIDRCIVLLVGCGIVSYCTTEDGKLDANVVRGEIRTHGRAPHHQGRGRYSDPELLRVAFLRHFPSPQLEPRGRKGTPSHHRSHHSHRRVKR